MGKQDVLFDNTLLNEDGQLEVYGQKTSLPGLIYRRLVEKLTEMVELRHMEVDDEAIDRCARRLMQLQGWQHGGKGRPDPPDHQR